MTSETKPARQGRKRAKYQESAADAQPEVENPALAAESALDIGVETLTQATEPEVVDVTAATEETLPTSENEEQIVSTALVPAIAQLERDKAEDEVVVDRVEHLNRGVGWVLISAGLIGMVVPGVLGTPFLIMGGLALWPGNRKRVERWRQGHSPKMFHGAMKQINRFLDDLEKRYPRIDKH